MGVAGATVHTAVVSSWCWKQGPERNKKGRGEECCFLRNYIISVTVKTFHTVLEDDQNFFQFYQFGKVDTYIDWDKYAFFIAVVLFPIVPPRPDRNSRGLEAVSPHTNRNIPDKGQQPRRPHPPCELSEPELLAESGGGGRAVHLAHKAAVSPGAHTEHRPSVQPLVPRPGGWRPETRPVQRGWGELT